MNILITEVRIPSTLDFDQLAASTRKAIQFAQQEAIRMQAPEVRPEHLLLGVLRQGEDGVGQVLRNLGVDIQAVRAGMSTLLGSDGFYEPDDCSWSLFIDDISC